MATTGDPPNLSPGQAHRYQLTSSFYEALRKLGRDLSHSPAAVDFVALRPLQERKGGKRSGVSREKEGQEYSQRTYASPSTEILRIVGRQPHLSKPTGLSLALRW